MGDAAKGSGALIYKSASMPGGLNGCGIAVQGRTGASAQRRRVLADRADGNWGGGTRAGERAAVSEREAFERIVASLHETALDRERWSSTTGLIDEALRTHGSCMAFGEGFSDEDVRIYFAWCIMRGQRHPELERAYFEDYYSLDERVPRLRRLPDSRLVHCTELYSEEELKTSAAYNELWARHHGGNAINVRLDGPDGTRIVWVVNDPLDGDAWSSAQLDSIRYLLPHIRQTVRVQEALAGAGALGASLAKLLDTTGLGIVQLDARARIAAANDRARDLLRGGEALLDELGFLHARNPEDDAELQRLLGRALPPYGAQGVGGSTMLRRPPAPPLLLHVNPVGPREADARVWPVAALVLVIDPASRTRIDPAVVAAALGLTRMESRVAVLLAEGLSIREAAALTGRGESTIRTHLKHIFTKHGLSRQTELVRLVLSLGGAP